MVIGFNGYFRKMEFKEKNLVFFGPCLLFRLIGGGLEKEFLDLYVWHRKRKLFCVWGGLWFGYVTGLGEVRNIYVFEGYVGSGEYWLTGRWQLNELVFSDTGLLCFMLNEDWVFLRNRDNVLGSKLKFGTVWSVDSVCLDAREIEINRVRETSKLVALKSWLMA